MLTYWSIQILRNSAVSCKLYVGVWIIKPTSVKISYAQKILLYIFFVKNAYLLVYTDSKKFYSLL
jgi:hypothetical protein